MQNMQKQTKYADIHTDFARKKLIDCTSDSKLRMNRAENGPNFAHHVVKPPAINGLILTHKVSAAAAVILFHRGRTHNKSHLGCLFPARNPESFFLWPHVVEERRQHGACGRLHSADVRHSAS